MLITWEHFHRVKFGLRSNKSETYRRIWPDFFWNFGLAHPFPWADPDTVGFAFGINNKVQAVGATGLCANTSLPPVHPAGAHAVLWEKDGTPIDLGSLVSRSP